MRIQIQHGVPVIHEVLLLENKQQAEARCLDPKQIAAWTAQTAPGNGFWVLAQI